MGQSTTWDRLVWVCFCAVLAGELLFSALSAYFGIGSPSTPFWLILYLFATTEVVRRGFSEGVKLKASVDDSMLLIFLGAITLSFELSGLGDSGEFYARLVLVMIGPYFIGRTVGRRQEAGLASSLLTLAILYVAVVAVEWMRNPIQFQNDRVFLFPPDSWDGSGGIPTAFQLGTCWGLAFVTVAATRLTDRNSVGRWMWYSIWILPPLLLALGSRTSMAALILCTGLLVASNSDSSTRRRISLAVGLVMLLSVGWRLLPVERMALLQDSWTAFSDFSAPTELAFRYDSSLGSVGGRLQQLALSLQLIGEHPVTGIGATNFGFYYYRPGVGFASPHSLLFQLWVELGIIGVALLGLVLGRVCLHGIKALKNTSRRGPLAAALVLWAFLLLQEQLYGNLYYDYHLFLAHGYLVSVVRKSRTASGRLIGGDEPTKEYLVRFGQHL